MLSEALRACVRELAAHTCEHQTDTVRVFFFSLPPQLCRKAERASQLTHSTAASRLTHTIDHATLLDTTLTFLGETSFHRVSEKGTKPQEDRA